MLVIEYIKSLFVYLDNRWPGTVAHVYRGAGKHIEG